ncbi:MAG: 16S rRNA (adenine(1518)-N(6)/adenine(1519)-N(6))-dimethyltransferase RsmA [Eubacteriales bacterium]|nr:16S rRNA (adenine(1518)-N(6)/adenine(1519)-N(6))-dimethyltransferase RsmA [Eubacteriales bacterium]
MKLTNPEVIHSIMSKSGIKFKKGLGQNFLIDDSVLEDIVVGSEITENTAVIEVGPGIGCLTQALAEKAGKVVSIEIDRGLVPLLNSLFVAYNNVEIIEGDILKTDLIPLIESFGDMEVRVAANLPYYITTPIIMKLLEEDLPIRSITVMVQKEVAERIVAKPGGKEYGALSVAVQYYSDAQIIRVVSSECFMPPPKVDSAVVKMVIGKKDLGVDEKKFFRLVKAAFAQRRKTLINSISGSNFYKMDKAQLKEAIESIGLNEKVRGEVLSLEQFAQLANIVE